MPPSPWQRAFVDESFQETADGGIYVLAAVVFDDGTHRAVRDAMLALRGAQYTQTALNEMDSRQKRTATKVVADRLVHELHSYAVAEMWVESRTTALNKRDIRTVHGRDSACPKARSFALSTSTGRMSHCSGLRTS